MKRYYNVLVLFLISNLSYSQKFEFAIIQDKDGFSNVRKTPEIKSKIVGTIKNKDLIFVFDNEDNSDWFNIESNNVSGFIHKSRIKQLKTFLEIHPKNQSENNIRFKNDFFSIDIFSESFDKSKFKITWEVEGNYIKLINGKNFYGTDGTIPKNGIKSITLKNNDKLISIDKNQMRDLFEPNFDNTQVFYDKSTQIIYLTMHNSDGAGGYSVAWVFEPSKLPKRFVLNTN